MTGGYEARTAAFDGFEDGAILDENMGGTTGAESPLTTGTSLIHARTGCLSRDACWFTDRWESLFPRCLRSSGSPVCGPASPWPARTDRTIWPKWLGRRWSTGTPRCAPGRRRNEGAFLERADAWGDGQGPVPTPSTPPFPCGDGESPAARDGVPDSAGEDVIVAVDG